jgi:hypothetical protein
MSDLNTPEGRYAASQSLGTEAYNERMREHIAQSCIETVNGYGIRPVTSRFGRLFAVVGTTRAFNTLDKARAYANGLPVQAVQS